MEFVWVVEGDGDLGVYRSKDEAISFARWLGFNFEDAIKNDKWEEKDGGFDALSGIYCRRVEILEEGEQS